MGVRAWVVGPLAAGALLWGTGCKTPDGTSPPEPKEEHPAADDVVLRGCGADAAGQWGDDRFFTAEELVAHLDDGWDVVAAEARPRPHRGPDGVERTIRDTVLVARRR